MACDVRMNTSWLSETWCAGMNADTLAYFTRALMISANEGLDGALHKRHLSSIHPDGERRTDLEAELVKRDLWTKHGDGYQFRDWNVKVYHGGLNQSTAEDIEEGRAKTRIRKANQRMREKEGRDLTEEEKEKLRR